MLAIVQHFKPASPMSDMLSFQPSIASPACEPEILAYGGAWQAALSLRLGLRRGRCVVLDQEHRGPLRLQKLLWPEGPNPAHAIVLHPPGGLASGDELELSLELEPGAGLLMTTPGAAKWYRAQTPSGCPRKPWCLRVQRYGQVPIGTSMKTPSRRVWIFLFLGARKAANLISQLTCIKAVRCM
ncbi:MAG: hypothetical protein EBS61_00420 [Betaproteobacteria bacterium]|nr:hypothetical protein [Betaproteobacteria bacterium]